MAPPKSSGKMSNTEKPPREIRDKVLWDPEYAAQHKGKFDSSESEDEDFSDYEFGTEPYVSGGGQAQGQAVGQVPLDKSNRLPASQANPRLDKGKDHHRAGHDGFQEVSYRRQKPRVPRRMDLNFSRDNTAKAAFRKLEPPNAKFILPRDCNEIEPNRVKMYDYFEEMGIRLGSFVQPPQHLRDRTILLWGNEEQIRRTKSELDDWLHPSPQGAGPRHKSEKFAKVLSVQGDQYKRLQKKMKLEADIRKFQQEPEKGKVFECSGSFLWPKDEVSATDLLGANLEALDPIRIKYRCHILFDAQLSVFRILTNNIVSVRDTLPRFSGIMKEYVARSKRPIVRYYIEPPNSSNFQENIKIHGATNSNLVPLMTGKSLKEGSRDTWLKQSVDLQAQSTRGIEGALQKTIPDLAFYRGRVRMRVHFGTFALTMFRWPGEENSISLEEFIKRLGSFGTKGKLIKDLQIKKNPATIMDKIKKAIKLFQPVDNYTESLADVSPSFSAYFVFDENEKASTKLEVEMVANPTDPNLYETTSAVWSRSLHRRTPTPLEIYMIRLDSGPSWKLEASSDSTIDAARISPQMIAFRDSIKLRKSSDIQVELTGQKVFQWNDIPGSMRVIAFEQKTSFKYRLVRNMDYIVEISRYDTYERSQSLPQKTTWAANLWNTEWDSEFMANTGLGIGQAADWDTKLETFFPAQYTSSTSEGGARQGITEFLEIVRDVSSLLHHIKRELPHLRK